MPIWSPVHARIQKNPSVGPDDVFFFLFLAINVIWANGNNWTWWVQLLLQGCPYQETRIATCDFPDGGGGVPLPLPPLIPLMQFFSVFSRQIKWKTFNTRATGNFSTLKTHCTKLSKRGVSLIWYGSNFAYLFILRVSSQQPLVCKMAMWLCRASFWPVEVFE